MPVSIKFFSAGYCVHPEKIVLNDRKFGIKKFPALWALIKHSELGFCLFDTGYSEYFYKETGKFPYNIYKKITPVYFQEEDSAVYQLNQIGIKPEDIKYVILSHFHADHIAASRDFPNSKFICSKNAFDFLKNKKGFSALKQGFIPGLLPDNFEERMIDIKDYPNINLSDKYSPFKLGFDLFEDQSVITVPLEGHACGQLGLLISTDDKTYFLVSDAAWTSRSYKELVQPHKIADLLFYNKKQCVKTLENIHTLYKQNPDITIIPSHCSEALQNITGENYDR